MTVFPDTRRSALVTGATGFIGTVVTGHMASGGYTVRAGTRRSPSSAVSPDGIVPTPCDLDDLAQTRGAVADVELVVHAAYGDEAAMVAQCRTLLQAMTEANVSALVYFSSIAVYGDCVGVIEEGMTASGSLGAYARAKVECEALIGAWARDPAHPWRRVLIVRPGIVYGTGSRFWTDKLAERITAGAWGNFGRAGDGPAPLVHVDDIGALVAEAGHALLAGPAAGWPHLTVLNVVGPETPTWNEYFAALAQRVGAPKLPVVGGMRLGLRQSLAVAAKIGRRLGLAGSKRAALAPTRAEMAIFGRDAVYSTRAATDLGLASRIGLDEGLARTVFPQAKL